MESQRTNIPTPSVRRLSLYLRELETLEMQSLRTVSSRKLAETLGLTGAQVRKDLAYFGQFGRPGVGYEVTPLIQRIRHILGTDKTSNTLLVGVGNIGRAVAGYGGFKDKRFDLVALFDADSEKVGGEVGSIPVLGLDRLKETIDEHNIRMAIITVPAEEAQTVANLLIEAGILGILNFAPTRIKVPSHVTIRSLDVAAELEQLSFMIARE
ncbi:MAG: redox-sensing transcriptional repressor Rex [Planctomycetota bacterium]|jgi:redox-sensing transcriptional repressor